MLGLRWEGLGAALVIPTLLTVVAFAAPLVHMRIDRKVAIAVSDLRQGDLRAWRDLVLAPLAEEFVFRACLVPLFLLQVCLVPLVLLQVSRCLMGSTFAWGLRLCSLMWPSGSP